jgi:predicted MPP superfamily phosphohydrolase
MFPIVFIVIFVLALNFGHAALQAYLLRRHQLARRLPVLALYLWAFAMCAFLMLQVFEPPAWEHFSRNWLYLFLAVAMGWNLMVLVLVPGSILQVLFVRRTDRLARKPQPRPETPEEISRRKFLYLLSYGAAPAAALGMGAYGTLTSDDLRIRKFDISIAGLPPELEGFTIAHVSDLHSGVFVGPKRLKIISDAANDLKADMVAITGDFINHWMEEFPAALTAIQAIESRYGSYLCEGNHDLFPGPGLMAAACAENNLRLLRNANAILPVQNRRLIIGGLPWMSMSNPEMVSSLFPERQEGDVRILLAHHPHLFDVADSADLVLSGHTHGGQIMVGDIGLGRIRFKYCSGMFSKPTSNTTLIVSNGCGDWFPCRIGAPAEIGLLRLTRARI